VAEENWALDERHPWVAGVATLRPPLGPSAFRFGLACLLDGLAD
jgi:hypothetical protein